MGPGGFCTGVHKVSAKAGGLHAPFWEQGVKMGSTFSGTTKPNLSSADWFEGAGGGNNNPAFRRTLGSEADLWQRTRNEKHQRMSSQTWRASATPSLWPGPLGAPGSLG